MSDAVYRATCCTAELQIHTKRSKMVVTGLAAFSTLT